MTRRLQLSFTLRLKWDFGLVAMMSQCAFLSSILQMAYWFGFAAVAGAFGGLIAFGVQHINSSVSNWRLLFIIEV